METSQQKFINRGTFVYMQGRRASTMSCQQYRQCHVDNEELNKNYYSIW